MNQPAFHPEALGDIREIWHYIAADSPDAADKVVDDIEARLQNLVSFPHQGQ